MFRDCRFGDPCRLSSRAVPSTLLLFPTFYATDGQFQRRRFSREVNATVCARQKNATGTIRGDFNCVAGCGGGYVIGISVCWKKMRNNLLRSYAMLDSNRMRSITQSQLGSPTYVVRCQLAAECMSWANVHLALDFALFTYFLGILLLCFFYSFSRSVEENRLFCGVHKSKSFGRCAGCFDSLCLRLSCN